MPRLIDANKACRIVEQLFCGVCRSYTHCDGCPYNNVLMLLRNLPTVEAEPVVRCKDCKHWAWPNTCCLETITRYEDDYCSRAERREDAKAD